MVSNTQYRIVGDYLCHRGRNSKTIWVTKLKEKDQDFIPVNSLEDDSNVYNERDSCGLDIKNITKYYDMGQIQMIEIPKSSFKAIPSNGSNELYNSLLQVTIGEHGIIFNLGKEPIQEIDAIENIDSF